MSITQRLRKFLRCNLAVLIVSSAVVVLPVAMQTPQRANAAGMTGFSRVVAGDSFTCGVKTDGTVWCWGRNHKKQLGDGTTTTRSRPVQVLGLTGATQIIAGQWFACALKSNGTVACWGDNDYGQLGDGTTTGRSTPAVIPNLTDVTQISGNYAHVCARLSDSTARCWGWNVLQNLGDGTTTNRPSPVAPSNLTDVAQISAGVFHTCARLNDKTVRCWGAGNNGGLGDGNTTSTTSTKTSPTGLSDVVQIATGGGWNNQCALLSTGVLKCWGLNTNGQVGNGIVLTGSTIKQLTPVTTGPFPAAISSVDFGMYTSCAVLLDQSKSAVCWGYNGDGQIGDGTVVSKSVPTLVSGVTGVDQISTNYYHSCAVLSDTTVKCWGRNMYGELGNGTTVGSLTAVSIPAFLDIPTPVVAAATVSVSKSIDVSWGAVTNKTSYTVRLYDVAGTSVLATKAGITATSTTFTSAEYASIADNTNYKVTVTAIGDGTDYINSDESAKVSLTASATPNIIDQPAAAIRTFGQSVTFSVVASVTDGGTLSYQWLKSGASIPSATSSSYTISPLATTDAGSFSVRVTNTVTGKVTAFTTSSAVALTVADALSIGTPAVGLSGTANSAFSLAVPGSGGRASLTYALTGTLVNGLSLSASTGTISGTPTVAGSSTVSVRVTDANGAIASTSNFTISIGYVSTTVSLELAAGSPQYRTTKRITATTSRAGTVNFKLDGTSITGCGAVAAASTTAVCDWVPVDLGAAALSAEFTPTSSTAYSNSIASLSATVTGRAITITPTGSQSKLFGDSDPVIQYSITSGSLHGLDTLSGALSRAAGEDVGTYQIAIGSLSNANYVITLAPVSFTIRGAGSPTISSQPVSANRTSGQSVTFSVSAASPDAGTLSYQWRKDGVAVLNATLASYTINSLSTFDAGSYTVVVTNTINNGVSLSTASTTSSTAALTVAAALTIATPITGLSGTANSVFSLAVPGSGGRASLTYALTGTLVNGLNLSTSTGTISGTPTVSGSSIVSVTVTDANGAIASTSNFTVSIGYASTTVSLELAAGSPQYRTTKRITATTSRAGTVNFKLGGISIDGCESVAATTTTATCDWVPIDLGAAALTAEFTPTSSTAYSNSTASLSATVVGRAITVTPTANQTKVFGSSEPVISYSITSGFAVWLGYFDWCTVTCFRRRCRNICNYCGKSL
jgi:alpha-tubulin suppressor-like RCC1 family protein